MKIGLFISAFLILQVLAALLFKWGTLSSQNYWWGYISGNLLGVISCLFLLGIYKVLTPEITVAIATGGPFILAQVAMMLVFHNQVTPLQWVGISIILAGILIVTFCKH